MARLIWITGSISKEPEEDDLVEKSDRVDVSESGLKKRQRLLRMPAGRSLLYGLSPRKDVVAKYI